MIEQQKIEQPKTKEQIITDLKEGHFDLKNFKEIPTEWHSDIALAFLEENQIIRDTFFRLYNAGYFKDLNKQVALEISYYGADFKRSEYFKEVTETEFEEIANLTSILTKIRLEQYNLNSKEWQNLPAEKQNWLADKLIEENKLTPMDLYRVLVNLKHLNLEIIFKLIESDKGDLVISNLEIFSGVDHNILLDKLLENRSGRRASANSALYHLEKFQGIDHQKLALKLIKDDKSDLLARYFNKFMDINRQEIIDILLKNKKFGQIADFLEKFPELDHQEFSEMLLAHGSGHYLARNLEKFTGLDHQDVATKLFKANMGSEVANYLEKFIGLDHVKIALDLFNSGQGAWVAQNIAKFKTMNNEIALKLIADNQSKLVGENLERFSGLTKEVAQKLIKEKQSWSIVANIGKFNEADHKAIALMLIDTVNIPNLATFINKFKNLDQEVMLKLIKVGWGGVVVDYFEKFQDFDHNAVALALLDAGNSQMLIRHLSKFKDLNKVVAIRLIEEEKGKALPLLAEHFKDLDQDVLISIIRIGQGNYVAENLNIFNHLDQKVAVELIKFGYGLNVMNNLDYFDGIDQLAIAKAMADNGQKGFVKLNRDIFSDLSEEEIENL